MTRRYWPGLCAAVGLSMTVGAAMAPLSAQEQVEPSKTLIPGKGSELTTARCIVCHDATHITRTRLSRAEWEDNVQVMITRGMPIAPDEIPQVVEYLATYYNRDVAAPPAGAPAQPTTASEGNPVQKLLSANGCIACHAVDRRLVGPGFREIAQRYRNDSGAVDRLARKIREGGSGAWGPTPMPPHPQLDNATLALIAGWVMEQQ